MRRVFLAQLGTDGDAMVRTLVNGLAWLGWGTTMQPGARVFIKPNLTWRTPVRGVTTSPEAIEAVVRVVRDSTSRVTIGEADGGYHTYKAEEAFASHGLFRLAKRYGVEVLNLSGVATERATTPVAGREISLELPSVLLHEIDVFITIPVPKVHAMTGVSLAFKNQWGCLAGTMRLRNHPQFAHKVVAINKLLRPRLAVYDGRHFLNINGPMAGEPVPMNLLVASGDIGAGDYVCCQLMQIDPARIRHLRVARQEGMFPASGTEVEASQDPGVWARPFRLRRTLLNWLALAAFHSDLGTRLFYDSRLAGPLHTMLYGLRRHPAIRRLLYGDYAHPGTFAEDPASKESAR